MFSHSINNNMTVFIEFWPLDPLANAGSGRGGGLFFMIFKAKNIRDKIRYSNLSNKMMISELWTTIILIIKIQYVDGQAAHMTFALELAEHPLPDHAGSIPVYGNENGLGKNLNPNGTLMFQYLTSKIWDWYCQETGILKMSGPFAIYCAVGSFQKTMTASSQMELFPHPFLQYLLTMFNRCFNP